MAAGHSRQHVIFLAIVVAPIGIMLVLVWGWIVGAPPGALAYSDHAGGVTFAAETTLRIALLGGLFTLVVRTIPQEEVVSTLRAWGCRKETLVVLVGTLALLPELRARAEQILTARYARGLIADRRFTSRLRQLPYLLRPLTAWVLRSALQRGETWAQRDLIARIERLPQNTANSSDTMSAGVIITAALFLMLSVLHRVIEK